MMLKFVFFLNGYGYDFIIGNFNVFKCGLSQA